MKEPESLSASVEDYLKCIYELEVAGGAAATREIAVRLGVAAASVSGMIRRLSEHGWVEHERYRGVRLTAEGRRAALRMVRRHRVIESYLTQALGYPWDRVHDEAERLEHAASDELVDRMAAAIGEPATDPHGAPIPTREGTIDERSHPVLADVPPGCRTRVLRVADEDPARLRYLAELGLVPGAEVEVVARAPFGGPITLATPHAEQHVATELAATVVVETPA